MRKHQNCYGIEVEVARQRVRRNYDRELSSREAHRVSMRQVAPGILDLLRRCLYVPVSGEPLQEENRRRRGQHVSITKAAAAAGVTHGPVFRAINKAGRVWGAGMSPKVL